MGKQALDGRRLNGFWMNPDDLVIVGIDTPHKKGEHPLWDERINLPLAENMVLNIMAEGVHEPIIVRKEGDTPFVVNGRQRVRHAREANKRLTAAGKEPVEIKTIVERGSDDRMFGIMVSTNELRREDAFEAKLSKLERYMAMGKDEQQAAVVFGVAVPTIKTWLAILEAGPEVKGAIRDGLLTHTAAAKIATQPRDKQSALIKEVREAAKESGIVPANGSNGHANGNGKAKRVSAEEVRRKVKNADAEPDKRVHEKPGAVTVRHLLEACDADGRETLGGDRTYDKGFFDALRWLRGELAADRIKGLKGMLRSVSKEEF